MSVQRRRGIPALIYCSHETTDRRGNTVNIVDDTDPISTKVAVIPQRSAKAEVPGQQAINVTRILVSHEREGEIDLQSRVEFMGKVWDVVTPPAYHHGTRRTRHVSIDIRQRPS